MSDAIKIERPRGTHDIVPAEQPLWRRVTGEIERLCSLYGYRQNRRESFREGRWKLHLAQPSELYDLERDLSESSNVAAQHPDIVKRLTSRLIEHREATRALPPNP